MYTGRIIFSQVLDHLPSHIFRHCIARYQRKSPCQKIHLSRPVPMHGFRSAHLSRKSTRYRSLSSAQKSKLYHMGIQARISRSTLAEANEKRDWRIYADLSQSLIQIARKLYIDEDFGVDLDNTVYALDASTIDLCLSVFPWARFRTTKAAVKLHTLLDLTRQYSKLYPYLRRQTARGKRSRSPYSRTRFFLHHGSWLSGFRTAISSHPGFSFFRDSSQIKSQISKALFDYRGQECRFKARSNRSSNRFLHLPSIIRTSCGA